MKTKLFALAILTISLIMLSCSKNVNPEIEKNEVKKMIHDLYHSFETKDMNLMSTIMAHDEDMVNFGTDLSDYEVGWKEWKTSHLAQFEAFDKAKLTSKDLTIFLSQIGNVAWFADISDWLIVVKNDSINVNSVRITGVLEKRDNLWKIVQIHASVPQN